MTQNKAARGHRNFPLVAYKPIYQDELIAEFT